jgi:GNAT superfamily N-acetyltransferase
VTQVTRLTRVTFGLEAVESSKDPAFAEAYGALDAEFGPRGELERREVVARWLDGPIASSRLERTYHLLIARDSSDDGGSLAGVRDCHVVMDRAEGIVVVYLAHALVMPPYRRSGLGALLRSAPISIARRALGEAGLGASKVDILLAAEMEPASRDDEASIVRLIAYGKEGFAAIAPSALPYCQPDFRDLDGPDGPDRRREPRPIPLLAVVRYLGHEGAVSLSTRLARAFVTHLYAVFATHVRPDHLAALEARTLGVLDALGTREVPLLPLPRTIDDEARVIPLTELR